MNPGQSFDSNYDYSSFCSYYPEGSYLPDEYWDSLSAYYSQAYINLIKSYFRELSSSCQDGTISAVEWSRIMEIAKQFEGMDYLVN